MKLLMTLSLGIMLSNAALASHGDVSCERMANSESGQELCFQEIDREVALLDTQLESIDARSLRVDAQVQIGSNPCEAEGLTASITSTPDEQGHAVLVAHVKGWRETHRICDRAYIPVFRDVSLMLNQDAGPFEIIVLHAQEMGRVQTFSSAN